MLACSLGVFLLEMFSDIPLCRLHAPLASCGIQCLASYRMAKAEVHLLRLCLCSGAGLAQQWAGRRALCFQLVARKQLHNIIRICLLSLKVAEWGLCVWSGKRSES